MNLILEGNYKSESVKRFWMDPRMGQGAFFDEATQQLLDNNEYVFVQLFETEGGEYLNVDPEDKHKMYYGN